MIFCGENLCQPVGPTGVFLYEKRLVVWEIPCYNEKKSVGGAPCCEEMPIIKRKKRGLNK